MLVVHRDQRRFPCRCILALDFELFREGIEILILGLVDSSLAVNESYQVWFNNGKRGNKHVVLTGVPYSDESGCLSNGSQFILNAIKLFG